MKSYEDKLSYLIERQKGLCPIASAHGEIAAFPWDLHHRLHNHKNYRARFPLFIDSILNLAAVNHDWHIANPSALHIGMYQADCYERFLSCHPEIAHWVNDPSLPLFHKKQKPIIYRRATYEIKI